MKRSRPLDGLRGIAILLVLLQHIVVTRETPYSLTFRWFLERFTSIGHTGVDLFFALSGFLLAGILIDHGRSTGALIVFYLRRACRILPLYLTFLALVVAVSWANSRFHLNWGIKRQLPLWYYLTFTQNIGMVLRHSWANPLFTPLWSLAVEEQFYLLLPILILSLRKRAAFAVAVALMAVAVAFRIHWRGTLAVDLCLPWRGDGLFVGVIAAFIVRDEKLLERVHRHRKWLAALAVVLACGWISFAFEPRRFGPFTLTWIAAFCGVLVLLAATSQEDGAMGRILGGSLLAWIGTISYGVYILHRLILYLVFETTFRQLPSVKTIPDGLLSLAGILLTFFIADLSYEHFERPIIAFGHRFQYSTPEDERPIDGAPMMTVG